MLAGAEIWAAFIGTSQEISWSLADIAELIFPFSHDSVVPQVHQHYTRNIC